MNMYADMTRLVVSVRVEFRGKVSDIVDVLSPYTAKGYVVLDRWGEQGVCTFRVRPDYLQEIRQKFPGAYYIMEERTTRVVEPEEVDKIHR